MTIAGRAEAGETTAVTALERYQQQLAFALVTVINVLDPDIIVLGGGVSNIASLYHQVPKLWQQYIFSDVVTTELLAPAWGDASGARGAAWLESTPG